jgi:hypothetical protein
MTLDVILFRQGRNFRGVAAQLADSLQHDLGAAVVSLHLSLDFDLPSRQPADVPNWLQIARKHDNGKGTDPKVFAEIEEVHAAVALLHANDFPAYAPPGADVVTGFGERNTLPKAGSPEDDQQNDGTQES